MALPRFIGLQSKSNSKYLHYIKEDVDQTRGFLRSSGEEVVSPYAKFEVQIAKNCTGLVNIRCVYNNKYFVSKSQDDWWIVAGARETDEDKSKWSCTLFEPVFVDSKTIRFRHVQLGHYVAIRKTGDAFDSCIYAGCQAADNDQNDVFTITDWESLSILPKHVAFKGDNGKYLSSKWIQNREYLQFTSDDIGDPLVGHETFTTSDGSIRLKSNHYGKFWKCSPNWIWTNSVDNSSKDLDTLFQVVKIDENNTVSLRGVGNKNYCKRLTAECKTDCLSASISSISKEARMVVEERVLSRSIYNVNYHLQESRIYDETVVMMANGNAVNRSKKPTTVNICRLSYKEAISKTWNSSVSVKTGVKTNFRAGVPIIDCGVIKVLAEVTGQWQWGTTEESSTELETVYKVTVPPMSAVKVSLLATKGSCDVPFSYYQRDVLMNGDTVIYTMDDGIYTGVNYYDFKYESLEEKLS
ncbi:hypothetical protein LguiB_026870 [Lonicera macranthoides]